MKLVICRRVADAEIEVKLGCDSGTIIVFVYPAFGIQSVLVLANQILGPTSLEELFRVRVRVGGKGESSWDEG